MFNCYLQFNLKHWSNQQYKRVKVGDKCAVLLSLLPKQ